MPIRSGTLFVNRQLAGDRVSLFTAATTTRSQPHPFSSPQTFLCRSFSNRLSIPLAWGANDAAHFTWEKKKECLVPAQFALIAPGSDLLRKLRQDLGLTKSCRKSLQMVKGVGPPQRAGFNEKSFMHPVSIRIRTAAQLCQRLIW